MKYLLAILGFVVLLIFAIYVWPTRYRYDVASTGSSGHAQLIRVNRFSDRSYQLTSRGWLPLLPPCPADLVKQYGGVRDLGTVTDLFAQYGPGRNIFSGMPVAYENCLP